METIAQNIQRLQETKEAIKQALINKAVSVSNTDTFYSYANKINNIQTIPSSGVFIYATDGTLNDIDKWTSLGKSARGVAIVTPKHRFLLAPTKPKIDKTGWYFAIGDTIEGLPITVDADINDFNGKEYTAILVNNPTYSKWPVYQCYTYSYADIQEGNWYLPSIGEWNCIMRSFGAVQDALQIIEGDSLYRNEEYWTSNIYDTRIAWTCYTNSNGSNRWDKRSMSYEYCVRACAPLNI